MSVSWTHITRIVAIAFLRTLRLAVWINAVGILVICRLLKDNTPILRNRSVSRWLWIEIDRLSALIIHVYGEYLAAYHYGHSGFICHLLLAFHDNYAARINENMLHDEKLQ